MVDIRAPSQRQQEAAVVAPPAAPRLAARPAALTELMRRAEEQGIELEKTTSLPLEFCDWLDAQPSTGSGDGSGLQQCSLTWLAHGTGAALHAAFDCGAHLCELRSRLFSALTPHGDYEVDFRFGMELSSDHRSLLVGVLEFDDERMTPHGPALANPHVDRIDLTTGRREHFADCISPTLSPDNQDYACRNFEGDVLRVPVEGGRPELVVPAEIPDGDRVKLGASFEDYPAPVRFVSAREIEYTLYLEIAEEVVTRRAQW